VDVADTMSENAAPAGSSTYNSDTMYVGDGTWIASENTFLLPNLQGLNFATMQYNSKSCRNARRLLSDHQILTSVRHVKSLRCLATISPSHHWPWCPCRHRLPSGSTFGHFHCPFLLRQPSPRSASAYMASDSHRWPTHCRLHSRVQRRRSRAQSHQPSSWHRSCSLYTGLSTSPCWEPRTSLREGKGQEKVTPESHGMLRRICVLLHFYKIADLRCSYINGLAGLLLCLGPPRYLWA